MITEKQISADELMRRLDDVMSELETGKLVYFVTTPTENWRGQTEFVLGSPDVCARVLGLVDEEYGWPIDIDVHEVNRVEQLGPSYRSHPFVMRDGKPLAVGIQVCEYVDIKQKIEATSK